MVAAMCEEVQNPEREVPKAMGKLSLKPHSRSYILWALVGPN